MNVAIPRIPAHYVALPCSSCKRRVYTVEEDTKACCFMCAQFYDSFSFGYHDDAGKFHKYAKNSLIKEQKESYWVHGKKFSRTRDEHHSYRHKAK